MGPVYSKQTQRAELDVHTASDKPEGSLLEIFVSVFEFCFFILFYSSTF